MIASPTRYEIWRNVFLHLPSHKINGWDDVCLWRETDLLQFMRALCETNSSNYAQNIRIMNILNWANLCARCVSHHLLTGDWIFIRVLDIRVIRDLEPLNHKIFIFCCSRSKVTHPPASLQLAREKFQRIFVEISVLYRQINWLEIAFLGFTRLQWFFVVPTQSASAQWTIPASSVEIKFDDKDSN